MATILKQKTKYTPIITAPVSRTSCWLSLVACAAILILAGCTADDTLTGNVASYTPAAFTAGIESVALPGTRTVIGENGQTQWTQDDAVGTAFSFKKYCSSLAIVVKSLIFVRSDAEAPP